MSDRIHCSQCGAPAGWEQNEEVALRATEQARKLARFVVSLVGTSFPLYNGDTQEIGVDAGIIELRRAEPGSLDAEEWGKNAELYFLVDWVRELAGGE